MSPMVKRVLGFIIVGALVFGAYRYMEARPGMSVREELIAELRAYPQFDEHGEMLLGVIDEKHDALADQLTDRKGPYRARYYDIDADRYRSEMYNAMISALHDAGHEDAAISLDRFRARRSR